MASGSLFEWQLRIERQWLSIDNDVVIEAHYCQPGANGISIHLETGSVYIDFDEMTAEGPLDDLAIRRITRNQNQEMGWYYKDTHRWCEYGSQGSGGGASSIGSDFIEQKFNRNSNGSFQFTVGNITYNLDFSAMTQTNLSTSMMRKVRRRPKFNSIKANSTLQYSSSAQMNTTHFSNSSTFVWEFMGDEGIWTQYQKPGCSVDSAELERLYKLDRQSQVSFTARRFSYTLYFNGMFQLNNSMGTRRNVRRIQQQANSTSSGTRWQFRDIDDSWKDYSKGSSRGRCSISSADIEAAFQLDSTRIMTFKTGRFHYELDFSNMTQTNLDTSTTREVRRLLQ